tara:strand:+ start:138933 stop:140579 length:1647 start_codon:yes stop_codon:yes gene_type:complete
MGVFDRLFGNKKKEEEEARLKLEQETKAKLESEAAKKVEEDKADAQAKELEEERLAQEVEENQLAEANRLEQEAKAKLEAEAAQKAEEVRIAKEVADAQSKKDEEVRLTKEAEENQLAEANKLEQETKAKLEDEEAQKAEEDRLAKEASKAQSKKIEEERLAKEAEEEQLAESNKLEQEVKAKLEAEAQSKKIEKERLAEDAKEKQLVEAKKLEQKTKAKLEAEEAEGKSAGLFNRIFSKDKKESLDKGLEKTKQGFFNKLTRAVVGKSKVDAEVLDNLEEILITSDVGVETTLKVIGKIEERVARDKVLGVEELNSILKQEITNLLEENNSSEEVKFEVPKYADGPHVIMVVGVNGVGKTTTIGKLAYHFKKAGNSVVLGASDTFRAAAVDQLIIWADRVGVPIVQQGMGADPASVAFDTLQSAKAQNADVVIIDTAGRLHNKVNLMNELSKIKRVMDKVIPEAPHEVLLVLDGSTGQNAFEQAKQFAATTSITSLAITKLDGTAKGGVVIGISDQMKIPVKYIGVGESMEDLQPFNRSEFVDSLFS